MRRNKIKVYNLQPAQRLANAPAGRNFITALLLAPTLLLPNALAQSNSQSIETSWFEIEILAFSRDNSQRLLEQFPPKVTEIATRGSVDLLSPLYQPDLTAILLAAPACPLPEVALSADPELSLATDDVTAPLFATDEASLAAFQFQQSKINLPLSDGYQPLPELCALDHKANKALNAPLNAQLNASLPGAVLIRQQPPAQLPLTPQGQEQHQPQPYLAPDSALQLKDLAYQLQHRGNHQLLLHTAWRQPLAGKRAARSYRWFAGSNFGQQFDYFGRTKASAIQPATDSKGQLLQQITALEQALAQNPATPLAELQPAFNQLSNDPVWQLDGVVKVYSERMLFAETDFNLRRLSADGSTLSTYHSNDQTRLLIGEVHYLDHPHLGLVLQIRRFAPPLLPTEEHVVAAAGTQP